MIQSLSFESPNHGPIAAFLVKNVTAFLSYVILAQITPIYIA